MTTSSKRKPGWQKRLVTINDIVPLSLSDDRMYVITSKGRKYVFVKSLTKRNNYYFTREDKVKEGQEIVPVPEKFGVMENTYSGIPIKCRLEKLGKLIQKRGGKDA